MSIPHPPATPLPMSGTDEVPWGENDDKLVAYLTDPRTARPFRRPSPRPSVAFGFIINEERCCHWGRYILRAGQGPEVFKLPPEEFADALDGAIWSVRDILPPIIYFHIPELPRIQNRMSAVAKKSMDVGPLYFVFPLRDDGTSHNMSVPLDQDLIERVREKLGVGEQEPKWYRVDQIF